MSPDRAQGRRRRLQALEDAAPRRTRLTEAAAGAGAERSKQSVTASITQAGCVGATGTRQSAGDGAGGAPPHSDEQLFQCKGTLAQSRGGGPQAGTLQEELAAQQAVADHWQRLCDLIGSASGAKAAYLRPEPHAGAAALEANAQLAESRLAIGWSGSATDLALQVVDLDMGTRCARWTLSGGESFLVAPGAGAGPLSLVVAPDLASRSRLYRRGLPAPRSDSLDPALSTFRFPAGSWPPRSRSHLPCETLVERIGSAECGVAEATRRRQAGQYCPAARCRP